MLESTLKEQAAREEGGKLVGRASLTAIIKTQLSPFGGEEVAFVLTLWSADGEPSIYNSMVQSLGNFVESAVVNQDIEIRSA